MSNSTVRDMDPTTHRLPWPSLLTLGAVTFTVVAAEMLPTAVLPAMSAHLGVPQDRTGLLVSAWALTLVLATFPLVRLTRRFDSRRVIAAAVLVLGAASAVTAVAGTFGVALGSRLVGAAACGLLWATVNAHSAALVPAERLAPAVAVVLGGATLGTVLGVPAAAAAAEAWGWR
ncbi:MFS transporter, partial [Cellulomonas hominis]|nr:MFS transporter [Cellulomonas hominis]